MINSYLLVGAVIISTLCSMSYVFLRSVKGIRSRGLRASACFASLVKCTHARNDAIIGFMGAARFANLTEKGLVPEMLDARSKVILAEAEDFNTFLRVNTEATHAVTTYLETISNYKYKKFPDFSIRLENLRQANLDVETAIRDLSEVSNDYQNYLSKPINSFITRIRHQPSLSQIFQTL